MRPKAPPLTSTGWLNAAPFARADLSGQVTILVFWSPSCEASVTRLGEIELLIKRSVATHGETLRAVAVLSPRYPFEQSEAFALDAVARHRIDLPVIHDPKLEIWSRYSPGGWPAAIVVDHRRRVLGALLGLDDLDLLIEAAETAALRACTGSSLGGQPTLVDDWTAVDRSAPATTSDDWAWPSGVAALPDDRIAVADSGNDRVLIVGLSTDRRFGRVEASIEGLDQPSRVAAWGPSSIAISLPTLGQVVGVDRRSPGHLELLAEDLGRPQGLTEDRDGSIVVCDAIDEQLVRILPDASLGVVAGIGFTGLVDGPASGAELAQPVGITRTENGLAFLDAGSNNLRLLTDAGLVVSVTHNSFERFGLVDGPAHRAVLQRPTGLATLPDGSILVADTGNDRIRVVSERKVKTLGLAGLRRPEDVAVLRDGTVVVADTANHRLVIADTDGRSAWTLHLS